MHGIALLCKLKGMYITQSVLRTTYLGRFGWIVFGEFHRQRVIPACPHGLFFTGNVAFPLHQVCLPGVMDVWNVNMGAGSAGDCV